MKITHIEETRVHVPWQDRLKSHLHRFGWSSYQTNYIYQVHTDSDIVGITESAWQLPQSLTRRYIDADPFTHLLDEVSRPLGIAILDIMGKALNLPAHKLLGQQVREQVSLGYWTCDMGPEELAAEALESSRQGYRWMKIKGRPWFDPIEQLDALSTVVGSDFQIEIDPNGTMMNVEKALPLLRRLERFEQTDGVRGADSRSRPSGLSAAAPAGTHSLIVALDQGRSAWGEAKRWGDCSARAASRWLCGE